MKFPNLNPFRKARTPAEVEARIAEKAARRAAKLAAKGKAASLLEDAREGYRPKSLAVRTVEWSVGILFVAAMAIIFAGYMYDILFYGAQGAQTGNILITVGLILFAFVIRSVAAFGDVILHWTKPGAKDDPEEKGLEDLKSLSRGLLKGDSDRTWFRALWVFSIIACSVATVSFFSAGHESKQAQTQAIVATDTTVQLTQADRIAALERQKTEAKEARDTAVDAADETIKAVKDETPNVSADDNITIRDANASKNEANATYTEVLANLNGQINAIYAETGAQRIESQESQNSAQPFQSAYIFLARIVGTAEMWSIAGAWFFAILFELLIAKLLAIVSVLNKVLKRIAKGIQMREAADEMNARIALERMKSNIDVEGIRLKGIQAQERALADIELAHHEREVEKAQAQAEALREGRPWVDPDDLLDAMAAEQKAENEARIRKMLDRAERLRNGELDPDEEEDEELTDAQRRARRGGNASQTEKQRGKIRIGDTDPFEELKEAG
jgi:hypothetical protein